LTVEGLVTVARNLPEIAPGEYMQLSGTLSHHSSTGSNSRRKSASGSCPATAVWHPPLLGSGWSRHRPAPGGANRRPLWVGTLDIIEHHPNGCRRCRISVPKRGWHDRPTPGTSRNRSRRSCRLPARLRCEHQPGGQDLQADGDDALAVVQSDPYRLSARYLRAWASDC